MESTPRTNDEGLGRDASASDSTAGEPTTTHAEWGAGSPHLTISGDGLHRTFEITEDHVSIGSGGDSDLRLEGLDALHAEITHRDDDEYVLLVHGEAATRSADPALSPEDGEVLRTGAQFEIGSWRLVYGREEFADHGRPHGGREGGEGGHQPGQPARPDYSGQGEDAGDHGREETNEFPQ